VAEIDIQEFLDASGRSPFGRWFDGLNSVAAARHLSDDQVHALVAAHVQGPQWGFLGASHVNVLELNEALAGLR